MGVGLSCLGDNVVQKITLKLASMCKILEANFLYQKMTFFGVFWAKNGGFWGSKLEKRGNPPRFVDYHLKVGQITPKKGFFFEKEGLKR